MLATLKSPFDTTTRAVDGDFEGRHSFQTYGYGQREAIIRRDGSLDAGLKVVFFGGSGGSAEEVEREEMGGRAVLEWGRGCEGKGSYINPFAISRGHFCQQRTPTLSPR